ncbi:hypothetical protein [Myxococcus qinghaiensis]|uniref:hypothetical protein n=1 Tax=Myxococcus qinghaiensis TaxID=2906758 RepID=UPI0020A732A5|nr:hypothetical protein [Myxococcus qinghaiensis]MCP3162567.1 hypothetical protein [Myxococcus qinghaiensis]
MAQAREGAAPTGASATGIAQAPATTGSSATPSTTEQGTGGTGTTPPATAQGAGSPSSATAQGSGGTTAQGAGSPSSATAQGSGGTTAPAKAQGSGGTTAPATAQGPGSTTPAPSSAGPCSRDETFRITTVGKGKQPTVQVEPDPGYGKALRAAEVDLDGRGQQDLYVIFPTEAGSDGATMQALYVHCSGDRYAPVWGPEYTLELKPLDTRTQGWRDVVHREKSGTLDAPTVKRVTMRFQGDTYQDAATETEKP